MDRVVPHPVHILWSSSIHLTLLRTRSWQLQQDQGTRPTIDDVISRLTTAFGSSVGDVFAKADDVSINVGRTVVGARR